MIHMKEGDHIPWTHTRGIYGDPLFKPYEGQVLLVGYNNFSRHLPSDLAELCERLAHLEGFSSIATHSGSLRAAKIAPYHKQYPNSRALVFNRNGSLAWVLFEGEAVLTREEALAEVINTPIELRHVGNGWHYPDWRTYPDVENRPLDWGHLYMASQFTEPPPVDVLLQGVLDVLYASMHHMESDSDREELVSKTLESIQMLYDREEHLRYWDD
jgi:hypothetical protein